MFVFLNKFTDYIFSDNQQVFPATEIKRVKPLKAGELAPSFTIASRNGFWRGGLEGKSANPVLSLKQLAQRPLVLVFYSSYWNNLGQELLDVLLSARRRVQEAGGNLLVVSAEKIDEPLYSILADQGISLYYDLGQSLASLFGVYSEENPIWNRFSGIDINVPQLSAYVISPAKQVVYEFVAGDPDTFSADDLTTAVEIAKDSK